MNSTVFGIIHKSIQPTWYVAMQQNTLTISEIKRRGMSAIDDSLRLGPTYIVKRNKMAAVILTEAEYQRLTGQSAAKMPRMTAMEWLMAQPSNGRRSRTEIDSELSKERAW